jgi:peptide deformylase
MPRTGIVQAGDPVLYARAADVPARLFGTQALRDLVAHMVAVMRRAPGVGLAAPQVGIPLRVFVMEDTPALMQSLSGEELRARGRVAVTCQAWINPTWRPISDKKAAFFEGCLSIPGFEAEVSRHLDVELSGLDENGVEKKALAATGWPARIIQHEVDHLDGRLYVDCMHPRTFAAAAERERSGRADLLAQLGLPG